HEPGVTAHVTGRPAHWQRQRVPVYALPQARCAPRRGRLGTHRRFDAVPRRVGLGRDRRSRQPVTVVTPATSVVAGESVLSRTTSVWIGSPVSKLRSRPTGSSRLRGCLACWSRGDVSTRPHAAQRAACGLRTAAVIWQLTSLTGGFPKG